MMFVGVVLWGVSMWSGGQGWMLCRTLIVVHLELGKVVPKHAVVGVVAVVVGGSARLGRLADAVQLVRLRGPKVLALLQRRLTGPWVGHGIAVLVVVIGLAVQLLGEVCDPARDRLLRLLEALLDILADLGQVVVEEAVLAVGLAGALGGLLLPPLVAVGPIAALSLRVCPGALGLVVLGELTGVYLVLLELAAGLRRPWGLWRGRLGVFGLEVGVRHAQQRVERRLDLPPAGHEHRLNDFAVRVGEGFDQRGLCLLSRVYGARGLWRGDLCVAALAEAHAGLGRLGRRGRWRRHDRLVCAGRSGGIGRIVVVVKVELARRRWALGRLHLSDGRCK